MHQVLIGHVNVTNIGLVLVLAKKTLFVDGFFCPFVWVHKYSCVLISSAGCVCSVVFIVSDKQCCFSMSTVSCVHRAPWAVLSGW